MTQVLFATATLPLETDLDANFTEVYARSKYLTTDATRTTISTVGGAGSPFLATGQSGDQPYIEMQRWNGSGSNYGGARALAAGNGAMAFMRANDAVVASQTWIESARFDNSGNLLINNTAAAAGRVNIYYARGSQQGILLHPDADTGGGVAISFVNTASTSVGSISTSATVTTYATSSDYRLKTGIAPITASGAFVDALKPCTWTWVSNSTPGVGFIAHELQAVSPTSVTGTKDATQPIGDLKDGSGATLHAGVPQPAELSHGQVWTETGTQPIYQAVEYGSAEVIAMLVAELQSVRARLHALDGH